ncbi:MAG: DsbA family oxidoreductase [Rhizobiales bacterium]|nr:DsbA family oxidoreductase [Hyphomicrobiales bacterium]
MCPWCYIGKRRLEQALAATAAVDIDVRWRPFQLDATIPEGGMDRQEYLANKFGGAEGAAEVYKSVREAGAAEDIPFNFEGITRSPNTVNAHRVIRWSHSVGLQDQVVEGLFKLYFIDGGDLTDNDALVEAAGAAGMDREIVERLINSDADIEETKNEIALAQKMGVTGVPTFIVGQKYAIVGAQGPEIIAGAIAKVMEEGVQELPEERPS